MYSKFYGLSRKPFELTPNPNVIYLSETHQEALSVLLYGVYNRKGFLQISGDVGTGKSTLVQALLQKLGKNVHLCHIPNPNFTVAEFYYYICAKFELGEFDGNRAKFVLNLAGFLKQCRKKDEFALLIIDEAQVLSLELLEEIRLLSNQEYTESGVLSIFFVGQPELNALLKHKKMDPLRNRIGIRFNLDPLTLDETVTYIQFRLRKAGRTVLLFSQKAFQQIHAASGGIPRSINILCDNALLAGFADQRGVINENIIIDCVKELELSDVASPHSETDTISIEPEPELLSPEPVLKDDDQDRKQVKPNGVLRKIVFAFVIICVLFFTMKYTTSYWGKIPGTNSARAWFENFHVDKSLLEKFKKLFIVQKSAVKVNSAEQSMIPEKVIVSYGRQEEESNSQNKPAVETKPIAEPIKKTLIEQDSSTKAVETKQNSAKNNYKSNAGKAGPEATETNLAEIDVSAEQIEIKRNPDGTNYIIITRQLNTTQKPDEINHVSISNQVGGANIRSGPSMDENILRIVAPGYPLRVIDQQGGWSLVEDFKNRKGWVASIIIIENNTVILKSNKVNLLSGPGYHDDIVASMDYGTVMQVEEKEDRWLNVYIKDGIAGWVHEDMVWP